MKVSKKTKGVELNFHIFCLYYNVKQFRHEKDYRCNSEDCTVR